MLGRLRSLLVRIAAVGLLGSVAFAWPQGTPWKKTCEAGAQGGQGCVVTVTMTIANGAPCADNVTKYCVEIKVECPADQPPGDMKETCSDSRCDLCGNANTGLSLSCDGQCFGAAPLGTKNWGNVANDCSDLNVTVSNTPCP